MTTPATSVNMDQEEYEKLIGMTAPPQIEKNNLKQTIFILAKSFIASGVLFLPKAYALFLLIILTFFILFILISIISIFNNFSCDAN